MSELARLSREGGANVELALAGAPALRCQEVVRRIPGRRVVCRGLWQGQAVYAKLFIGRGAERYAARDARGARALTARGLLAPELLHEGGMANEAGRVLIYALVAESENVETLWQAADAVQRRHLADALVRAVAQHHAAGLVQTDLYPRNFLSTDAGVYTLDGDGIRIHRAPLALRPSLDNLALLLSKFDALEDARMPELLALYAAARGDLPPGMDAAKLAARVQTVRYRRVQKNVYRKVLRDCSEIRVEQAFGRYVAAVRSELDADLLQAIAAPDMLMSAPDSRRLKNGNTCTVGLVHAGAREIVIKRYNIKNFWHGLGRAWRRTRASVSWSNAHLLRAFEIATPAPLALIERRWGWLRREGYFLTEFVAGPDLLEVFADAEFPPARKQQVAIDTARLLRKLCLLRIEHGDMKATNLKLVDGRPLLLDLDAMQQHRCAWWFRRRHARDLRRFLKNWHNAPDILRMLQSALITTYGDDPVLTLAGIARHDTSEYT